MFYFDNPLCICENISGIGAKATSSGMKANALSGHGIPAWCGQTSCVISVAVGW